MRIQEESVQEWWCIDLGQSELFEKEVFDRLTESFYRFTPDVVQGRNRIFLEMSRTKHLFNLNGFMRRAEALARREELDASLWHFGIADTLPKAWIQTRWRAREARLLPVEAYFDFIDPLQHFELNRSMRERLSVFQSLGMKNLEYLFTVPKTAWLVRFGEEFDSFLESFEFGARFPWNRFVPSVGLQEKTRWNAEEYVIDAESLIFRLKPMLDRMCERLYSLRRALKKVEIILKLDRPVPDRRIELNFAFPQTSRSLLLKLLRERLGREMDRNPLSDPIVEAEIQVKEAVKRDHENTRFAFSERDEIEGGQSERWVELLSYLGLKLESQGQVFQAETTEHLLPEKSWKKVLLSDAKVDASLDSISHLYAKRPIQLFSEPIPIFRVGPYLKQNQELFRICEFSQEEHLEGYAWDVEETQGFDRTYYRVKVKSQEGHLQDWWIYKDELLGKLKLHGVY